MKIPVNTISMPSHDINLSCNDMHTYNSMKLHYYNNTVRLKTRDSVLQKSWVPPLYNGFNNNVFQLHCNSTVAAPTSGQLTCSLDLVLGSMVQPGSFCAILHSN